MNVLTRLIGHQCDTVCVFNIDNISELDELAGNQPLNVILIDGATLPKSVSRLGGLKRQLNRFNSIIFNLDRAMLSSVQLLQAGFAHQFTNCDTFDQVAEAIGKAVKNKTAISNSAILRLYAEFQELSAVPQSFSWQIPTLSESEIRIIELTLQEQSNAEIGRTLFMSLSNVKILKRKLARKLRVRGMNGVVCKII